jgi:hypothetical protein
MEGKIVGGVVKNLQNSPPNRVSPFAIEALQRFFGGQIAYALRFSAVPHGGICCIHCTCKFRIFQIHFAIQSSALHRQLQDLIRSQRQHREHQIRRYLAVSPHPDLPDSKFVLQPGIDPLYRGALSKPLLLRWSETARR